MTKTNTKIPVTTGKALQDTLTGSRDAIRQEVMAHKTSQEALALMGLKQGNSPKQK